MASESTSVGMDIGAGGMGRKKESLGLLTYLLSSWFRKGLNIYQNFVFRLSLPLSGSRKFTQHRLCNFKQPVDVVV